MTKAEEAQLVERILALADQVAQTEERSDHLKTRVPLGVATPTLNYREDTQALKAEYNQAVAVAVAAGYLSEDDLRQVGLPVQMPT